MDTRISAPVRHALPAAAPVEARASTPGGRAAAGGGCAPLSAAKLLRRIRLPSNSTPFLADTSVEEAFRATPRVSDIERWVASPGFDPGHRDAAGRDIWHLLADCSPITGDDIAAILTAAERKGLRTGPGRGDAPSSMLPLDRAIARKHVALIYTFLHYGEGFGGERTEDGRRERVRAIRAIVSDRRAASDERPGWRTGDRSLKGLLGRPAARRGMRDVEGETLDRIDAMIAAEDARAPAEQGPAARGATIDDIVEDVVVSIRNGAAEEAIAKLRALKGRGKAVRFAPEPTGA